MKTSIILLTLTISMTGCYQDTVKTFIASKHTSNTSLDTIFISEKNLDSGKEEKSFLVNPKISDIEKHGLGERDAMHLVTQGGIFSENSWELTTLGWIAVIILVILLLLAIASSDSFFLGFLVADALDDFTDSPD